ncbi:hypothetical protein HDU86_003591 [Geranomyces michiganensis]|nr:hypothetical protein HDU86_003591 [Geranomyces michiganensis]
MLFDRAARLVSNHAKAPFGPSFISSLRRFASASSSVEAWALKAREKKLVDYDTITAGHSHLLALTLDPTVSPEPDVTFPPGAVLPAGYHLALFPPRIAEPDLAADGYDNDYSPPSPYIQRMWAGGSFSFNPANRLRTGQQVKQTTTLDDVQLKHGPRGEAVMVWTEKLVENERGRSVLERRCLAYMPKERNPTSNPRSLQIKLKHDFVRQFRPTPVTLFRYSALTFNSHRIHYDNHYAREVEGYPDCLTHGPLTTTLLMDLLERNLPEDKQITLFNYRALSPLLVNDPITLCGKQTEPNQFELWATNKDGGLAMKGTATVE